MTSPITVDAQGNELLDFRPGHERDLERLDPGIPLPLALVVAEHESCPAA
ncbi:hypothetical protein [Paractinoplanes atraurantiacus]|uniref:Uncharacterized protein n=1 Tax=Paractinoplanes atraurantiacus TaxID=1036182 RepID=A0A285K177_9ACTN|nr:hypothetical protein [Actinoplanes atraurantiacus]SNY65071.1 hypothetical protein SAMN05421748_127126 [Actinoplanes atraurantiacus]